MDGFPRFFVFRMVEIDGNRLLCIIYIVYSAVLFPIASMYGTFTYIYHKNQPNVGKYTIVPWIRHWFHMVKTWLCQILDKPGRKQYTKHGNHLISSHWWRLEIQQKPCEIQSQTALYRGGSNDS